MEPRRILPSELQNVMQRLVTDLCAGDTALVKRASIDIFQDDPTANFFEDAPVRGYSYNLRPQN